MKLRNALCPRVKLLIEGLYDRMRQFRQAASVIQPSEFL